MHTTTTYQPTTRPTGAQETIMHTTNPSTVTAADHNIIAIAVGTPYRGDGLLVNVGSAHVRTGDHVRVYTDEDAYIARTDDYTLMQIVKEPVTNIVTVVDHGA
jgi:hypothetical protein